jgi:hypothetical protein
MSSDMSSSAGAAVESAVAYKAGTSTYVIKNPSLLGPGMMLLFSRQFVLFS